MDSILEKITQQAMNYAIRSGITISAGFAIREGARLLKNVKGSERGNIAKLQARLDSKIRIISPAIDMIELIAARGNTSLESAISLTKAIRVDIQALGTRLAEAANDEERIRRKSSKAKTRLQSDMELQLIIQDMKQLLERIEDAVPLINLAITTSGVNLSTTLPSTVSPSRLLQASTFLSAGDSQYAANSGRVTQIGPAFVLSLYMLFAGHSLRPHDEESIRETTWKEVIHKARVKLLRVPLSLVDRLNSPTGEDHENPAVKDHTDPHSDYQSIPSEGTAYEFAYQLLVMEDLNDDRVHTFDEGEVQPGPFDELSSVGIREIIPIHQISKIFYADTGKILNIGGEGETNNPILLLKRDINAPGPRRMEHEDAETLSIDEVSNGTDDEERQVGDDDAEAEAQLRRESAQVQIIVDTTPKASDDTEVWRFPSDLDPEWVALEVYVEEDPESEGDFDDQRRPEAAAMPVSENQETPSRLADKLSTMHINDNGDSFADATPSHNAQTAEIATPDSVQNHFRPHFNLRNLPPIQTSLSLLELLVRLTALQQFQQASHLTITDELLNFFLSEASTTGAGADSEYRRQVRRDARKRVGFDPYDESPIKFHGEDYVKQHAYNEPASFSDGQVPSLVGSPRSPSARSTMFRPSTSSRKGTRDQSLRSSFGSSSPSSPSPSLNRPNALRRPQGVARRIPVFNSPAEIRLASFVPETGMAADSDSYTESPVPLIDSLLEAKEDYIDSGLGTSPAEIQTRLDKEERG